MSDAKEWHVAHGSESLGPFTVEELRQGFQSGSYNRDTLVFRQGMSAWTAAHQVSELSSIVPGGTTSAPPPPPMTTGQRAHEVDYTITGEEMQFVEVELDPWRRSDRGSRRDDVHDLRHQHEHDLRRRERPGAAPASWTSSSAPVSACSPARACSSPSSPTREAASSTSPSPLPIPGRIMPVDLKQMGGKAHRAEGRLPVRRQGRRDQHRLPEEDRRRAVRRRGLHHAEPRR